MDRQTARLAAERFSGGRAGDGLDPFAGDGRVAGSRNAAVARSRPGLRNSRTFFAGWKLRWFLSEPRKNRGTSEGTRGEAAAPARSGGRDAGERAIRRYVDATNHRRRLRREHARELRLGDLVRT